MKFCWTTLMVKDLNESIEFYEKIVGLEVNIRFPAGQGAEIAVLGDGETKVELICDETIKEINIGKDISLGFEVDSVDKKMSFIKEKGYNIQGDPFKPNPHLKFFYITDPNGLKIQFVENIL